MSNDEYERHMKRAMKVLKFSAALLVISLIIQIVAILGKAGAFN